MIRSKFLNIAYWERAVGVNGKNETSPDKLQPKIDRSPK
jgi:hypothetical protein